MQLEPGLFLFQGFLDAAGQQRIWRLCEKLATGAVPMYTPTHPDARLTDAERDALAAGLEAMFAYLPAGDPLLRKKSVSQAALRDRKLWVMPEGHCFRSQVLSYCKRDARPPSGPIQFESGSFQTLMRLVDKGLGATVLPELVVLELPVARQKSQVRPLVNPMPVRELALVTALAPSGFAAASATRTEANTREIEVSAWAVGIGVDFLGIDDVSGVCGFHSGSRGGATQTGAGSANDARCRGNVFLQGVGGVAAGGRGVALAQ